MTDLAQTMARRAIDRAVSARQDAYVDEMQRIVDTTYRLIEASGDLEPSLRDILRATKLSTQAFYRYFQSKDELFLLILDDGRRQLLSYLDHQMQKAKTPAGQVRAWVEGVLAQAGQPDAAARTRPFFANEDRLAERFPDEHRASVDQLVGQLVSALRRLGPGGKAKVEAQRDAEAIYELAFGTLHRHLTVRSRPTPAEVDHVVRFALRGAGA
jgi:AcrR family transcriptional regulator